MTLTSSPATKQPRPPSSASTLAAPKPSLSNVLFSRCCSRQKRSSGEPASSRRAVPLMVALMLETADVLMLSSSEAREERCSGPGEPPEGRRADVGGRWETQSWTRRETLGFERRFVVLREAGFVVMAMMGAAEKGDDGR
ncbi:hypothetical protein HYQ46_010618 [Verticillium longisporum]|nr:hypothetical protein HYQ46_010618 [Verticillium longisporum]